MNVLVSLSYDNIRALEQARHILAAQAADHIELLTAALEQARRAA